MAASNGSIGAEPADPGATSTHTVTTTAGDTSAGSWNGLKVNYQGTGADVSGVTKAEIVKIGIDRGDDQSGTAIDVNVSDDLSSVSSSNNGETLTIGLGGSYSIKSGDELVVVYENVKNPGSAGTYDVEIDINHQSSGGATTASLTIGDATATETATPTPTPTETDGKAAEDTATATSTEEATATSTEEATATPTETKQKGPGFGVTVSVLALLGAAFLATRR